MDFSGFVIHILSLRYFVVENSEQSGNAMISKEISCVNPAL
jgi:hypothetical protein